jgi:Rrf2 family protein
MLGIARHTDYAARLVLHLAALGEDGRATLKEIAAKRLLPEPFVRRVVGRLATAGIVRTVRGAGGGVRLARPAHEISLLDVVRAMEGGVVLNRCVDSPAACPLSSACPVNRAWTDATRQLEGSLAGVRFSDLATRLESHVAHHGYPPDGHLLGGESR